MDNLPNKENLWGNWKEESLIKIDQPPYADISNTGSDSDYKKYLTEIKSSPSTIDVLGALNMGSSHLEKAAYVYRETMGSIYACVVMNAKVKIIKNLLTQIPMNQSNIQKNLKDTQGAITKSMVSKGCRDITSGTGELSLKKSLLDNTTYQYCTYRYYLYYLDYTAQNSFDTYKASAGGDGAKFFDQTNNVAEYISRVRTKIGTEISHTKEIFPQALVAYTEFERTYASHILLVMILEDYIELRSTLKQLMNPIGQVIYKASNCQAP